MWLKGRDGLGELAGPHLIISRHPLDTAFSLQPLQILLHPSPSVINSKQEYRPLRHLLGCRILVGNVFHDELHNRSRGFIVETGGGLKSENISKKTVSILFLPYPRAKHDGRDVSRRYRSDSFE